MNLIKNGKLLSDLRKSKKMTQKQVADKLGITAKTISKWETGRGFPDISLLSALADIFGVSERILLSGDITKNKVQAGNIKRAKFYVCECCGSVIEVMGESEIICWGKQLSPLLPKQSDSDHEISVSEIEDEMYIEFNHEMTKEHYISFICCIGFDRKLTIRLYPEQDAAVRISRIPRSKLLFYCTKHGLFIIDKK